MDKGLPLSFPRKIERYCCTSMVGHCANEATYARRPEKSLTNAMDSMTTPQAIIMMGTVMDIDQLRYIIWKECCIYSIAKASSISWPCCYVMSEDLIPAQNTFGENSRGNLEEAVRYLWYARTLNGQCSETKQNAFHARKISQSTDCIEAQ